jgi:hypothetical protein
LPPAAADTAFVLDRLEQMNTSDRASEKPDGKHREKVGGKDRGATVKRKSGWLAPRFGVTAEVRTFVERLAE